MYVCHTVCGSKERKDRNRDSRDRDRSKATETQRHTERECRYACICTPELARQQLCSELTASDHTDRTEIGPDEK